MAAYVNLLMVCSEDFDKPVTLTHTHTEHAIKMSTEEH